VSDHIDKHSEGPSQIVLYQTEDGRNHVQVRLENETVWLTQNLMAELYRTTKQNISLHIQNIYEEGELTPEATVKKYLTVRQEGLRSVRRLLDYYNLDVIIAVGYRVKSGVATQFRQWATERLREYLVKGFTLDDERLKGRDRVTTGGRCTEIIQKELEVEGVRSPVSDHSRQPSLSMPFPGRTTPTPASENLGDSALFDRLPSKHCITV